MEKNFNFDLSALTKLDFRIAVVSQELEQVIDDDQIDVAEKLLHKEIPDPSNETESQFFQILYEFRQVPNNSEKVFDKIDKSQAKNIYNEKSDVIHNSPTSYRNKKWYTEQIDSQLIGLIITSIFAITIGVDPTKTLLFASMLSYLLKFLK